MGESMRDLDGCCTHPRLRYEGGRWLLGLVPNGGPGAPQLTGRRLSTAPFWVVGGRAGERGAGQNRSTMGPRCLFFMGFQFFQGFFFG